jgi:hypothetical protein
MQWLLLTLPRWACLPTYGPGGVNQKAGTGAVVCIRMCDIDGADM